MTGEPAPRLLRSRRGGGCAPRASRASAFRSSPSPVPPVSWPCRLARARRRPRGARRRRAREPASGAYFPPPRRDEGCGSERGGRGFEREGKKKIRSVGFEPTPPKRLVPETSALDHSARTAKILCDIDRTRTCDPNGSRFLVYRLRCMRGLVSHLINHSATMSDSNPRPAGGNQLDSG